MEGGSQSQGRGGRRARHYVRGRNIDREMSHARATQRSVVSSRRTNEQLARIAATGGDMELDHEADDLMDGMLGDDAQHGRPEARSRSREPASAGSGAPGARE
eukprot:11734792-Alexandrium_andersonii.AAC.1